MEEKFADFSCTKLAALTLVPKTPRNRLFATVFYRGT